MKYRLLTKEQFEALHQEFSKFLAVQGVDKTSWESIKANDTERVDIFLKNFSDLVWEDVLNKTKHLQHISVQHINLFHCNEKTIDRILIQIDMPEKNLTEPNDFNWFLDHSNDKSIQYFSGSKAYESSRNQGIFELIEQGSEITDAKLYDAVSKMIRLKD